MEIKVALKYCGSCNPHFDLTKTGRSLIETIAQLPEFTLVSLSTNNVDIVLILCGCPRACGNKKEVRARAKHYLLINDEGSGDTANLEATILACMKA